MCRQSSGKCVFRAAVAAVGCQQHKLHLDYTWISEHGRQATALTNPQDAANEHGADRTPDHRTCGAQLGRALDHHVVPIVGCAVVGGGVVAGTVVGGPVVGGVVGGVIAQDRWMDGAVEDGAHPVKDGAVVHNEGWFVVDDDGRVPGYNLGVGLGEGLG